LKKKEIIKKLVKFIDFKDILMFFGVIATAKGLHMIYHPAMWLGVGIFLIYLGWPRGAVKNGDI